MHKLISAGIAIIAAATMVIPAYAQNKPIENTMCNAYVHSATIETYEDGTSAIIAQVEFAANDVFTLKLKPDYKGDMIDNGCAFHHVYSEKIGFYEGTLSQYTSDGEDVKSFQYMTITTDDSDLMYTVNLPMVRG